MIHGVLNIYKEKGYTSHDVVARLRRIVGQKKIGHTGTLDPEAEGVLPVCLGKATKLCDLLTDKDKTYEAVLLLGISTDTQDTTGKILEEKNTADLREEAVREVVLSFEGEYDQIPPMFSALKVGGKKLYELARDGKEVERKPRHVQISPREPISAHCATISVRNWDAEDAWNPCSGQEWSGLAWQKVSGFPKWSNLWMREHFRNI